ncbi:YggS family pyridoxal phosphate-dependent enzyme [Candidatus Peregrinibacteria bacterium]|nr:YggS family pyridoxal phosphate-dependent enzyme [Candidatus Peregrinibacteria bacterium]
MAFLIQKYQQLLLDIQKSCEKVGRKAVNVKIVAATKYSTVEEVNDALQVGITDIGENRVQDAIKKFPLLTVPCTKHFIGHLQTNKVKKAVELFDVIESVDRMDLLEKLAAETERVDKKLDVLLQVNIANDGAKFGCDPVEIDALIERLRSAKNLVFKGFMAIVPFAENVEDSRLWFRKMRQIFEKYQMKYGTLDTLSMGMSHDFQVAIEEGATQVRIGSLLF